MACLDCADFESLLDHLLGELRLELSRKYRLDMEKRGATQLFDCEAPKRALLDVRAEAMHSMFAPPDMDISRRPNPEDITMTYNIHVTDTERPVNRLPAFLQPSRPDANARVAWDVVMCSVMFLLIIIETTSLAILEFEQSTLAYWWSQLLLVAFTFDVLMSFNTAIVRIVGRKTVVICDRWQIAKAYLKGWFLIDALSTFPFDLVLGSTMSASGARLFKLGKMLRTARLVKGVLKIAKLLAQTREIQDQIHEYVLQLFGCPGHEIGKSQKYVTRVWWLFWFLLFEGHLIACFLLILTRNIPTMSWRINAKDIHELNPYSRYVAAFRDVIYVLTTGNGDLDVGDILFTVLVACFYMQLSVVISMFVGIKNDAGSDDQDFSMKCARLRRYLRHHRVLRRVRDEVDSHFSKVGKFAGMNLACLLEELPSSIRQSVTAGLYYPFYEGMAFFNQDAEVEYEIYASLETLFYRPHDTIVSVGSTLHGLHYLSEGYAAITLTVPSKAEEEAEWCAGNYLFLESLFAQKSSSASMKDVCAIDACEVWFLARAAFDRLLQETSPSFRSRVELVRSKVRFDEELYSWVMQVVDQDNQIEFVSLDFLVEGGRFPQPQRDDDLKSPPSEYDGIAPRELPSGKRFHFFLSHKKQHSKLGNRPELVAQSLHDALDAKGFIGFFDVDNLIEISRSSLEQAVRESCAMIVVLNDETAESDWCRLEWECASSNGIPVKCVVDAQHCNKADLLCNIRDVNTALLQYQWSEYLDRYRKSVAKDLADWLSTPVRHSLLTTQSPTKELCDIGASDQAAVLELDHNAVVAMEWTI